MLVINSHTMKSVIVVWVHVIVNHNLLRFFLILEGMMGEILLSWDHGIGRSRKGKLWSMYQRFAGVVNPCVDAHNIWVL